MADAPLPQPCSNSLPPHLGLLAALGHHGLALRLGAHPCAVRLDAIDGAGCSGDSGGLLRADRFGQGSAGGSSGRPGQQMRRPMFQSAHRAPPVSAPFTASNPIRQPTHYGSPAGRPGGCGTTFAFAAARSLPVACRPQHVHPSPLRYHGGAGSSTIPTTSGASLGGAFGF